MIFHQDSPITSRHLSCQLGTTRKIGYGNASRLASSALSVLHLRPDNESLSRI
jgi:hypothetical protein